ncbi:PREDICTED: RING-H2 finger protein ATL75-like [Tarenaya hassleriana]|uniref:RING-H2 finger protein ATL75-like n=1 Tax=Tarenaya hassleriana TaxID=28532 RepID=UPI00053C10BF|nr:PREDICTED: RING-H2 finger protein ATL75-like [Tarenaya hassleriana]
MSETHLPSSNVFQEDNLSGFVSRKLLLHNPFNPNPQQSLLELTPSPPETESNNLSGNALMLLSVLICGIICSLGLHYIIRCALRRSSSFMISDPISTSSPSTSNTGIKQKVLRMFPVVSYSPEMNLSGLGDECAICLSDFVNGEHLRLLPKCNHGFHVRCIDKWLKLHLSCPKCRHSLVETCQKILGDCNQTDHQESAPTTITPPENMIVNIAPLEPEGRMNSYRGSS